MPAVTLSVFSNSAQVVVLTVCVLGVGFMVWFSAGLLLDAGGVRKRDRRFPIITSSVFGRIRPGFRGVHSNTRKAGDGNLELLTVRFSSPQSTGDRRNRLPWIEVWYRDRLRKPEVVK